MDCADTELIQDGRCLAIDASSAVCVCQPKTQSRYRQQKYSAAFVAERIPGDAVRKGLGIEIIDHAPNRT